MLVYFPLLCKQTLVRTVKTSRMLFSLSPSLGLPATIACLSLAGKTHPEMLKSLRMIIACSYSGFTRVFVSQGNCLFGLLESSKLVEGLFERVCALTEECRGTCFLRSATNDEQWPSSSSYLYINTLKSSLKERRRELSVYITVLAADKGEP